MIFCKCVKSHCRVNCEVLITYRTMNEGMILIMVHIASFNDDDDWCGDYSMKHI